MNEELDIRDHVSLSGLTTLELGGPARHLLEATGQDAVIASLRWAEARSLPVFPLGGGSNVVVSDEGFDGLVLRITSRGVSYERRGDEVLVTAEAGEGWDGLVRKTVERDLAGLECLAGIPGLVGASPIQNIGAYGQEVADTIRCVRAVDRSDLSVVNLEPDRCEFGYRDSRMKREPDRYLVLAVTFALRPGGEATVRYAELERALAQEARPSLSAVRETVLRLRRAKSMTLEPHDENRRSVGSFFTNPIVSREQADRVIEQAVAWGQAADPAEVPCYPAGPGEAKLAAGWLIERAGINKGFREGSVGVSSRHALALVHHGGGTTRALLDLARKVRRAVRERFGVTLVPEPVLVGVAL